MSDQTPSDPARLRELAQRVLSAGRAATSAPWVLLQADTVPVIVFHPGESDQLQVCNAWDAFNADDERTPSELVANFELIALYRSAAPALAAALLRFVPEPGQVVEKSPGPVKEAMDLANKRADIFEKLVEREAARVDSAITKMAARAQGAAAKPAQSSAPEPAPALEPRGLKYHVARVDDRPLKGGCVVLEFGDERAAPALRLWADSMEQAGRPDVAAEIRARIGSREPVR